MDMSLVASVLAMQSASLHTNITMQLMASNARAEKQAVLTLLGASAPASSANLPAGVGGRVDIAA